MAIAYDAGSSNFSGGYAGGPTTKTWSHTCSTSDNRIIWLAVGIWQDVAGTGTVTSCTYGGSNLTKYVEALSGSMYTALYYLIAPATGANNFSVTVTGATDAIKFVASSYTGVAQSSFLDTYGTGTGGGTTATATLTTGTDNSEVVDSIIHYGTGAITKGANQTEIAKNNANSTAGGSSYLTTPKTPAGSVSMTWTWTGTGDWSCCAAAFKPASSGSSPSSSASPSPSSSPSNSPSRSTSLSPSLSPSSSPSVSAPWTAMPGAWMSIGNSNATTEYQDGRFLDVLNPFYYHLDAGDGTLTRLNSPADGANAYSSTNAADVKAHSTHQYFTVAGNSAADIRALVTSTTNKTNFKTTVKALLDSTGFTGVDCDFEDVWSWTATDYTNIKSFYNDLGTYLHTYGYKLQVDLPAFPDQTNEEYTEIRYADFDSLPIDRIAIMAYDYQYDTPNTAIAPISWVESVCDYIKSKITDDSRIVIGIPSYSYQGTTDTTANDVNHTKLETSGFTGYNTATRDSGSQEMHWTYTTPNPDVCNWYNDTTSMDAKRSAIEAKGISHVQVWVLGDNDWFSEVEPSPSSSVSPSSSISSSPSSSSSSSVSPSSSASLSPSRSPSSSSSASVSPSSSVSLSPSSSSSASVSPSSSVSLSQSRSISLSPSSSTSSSPSPSSSVSLSPSSSISSSPSPSSSISPSPSLSPSLSSSSSQSSSISSSPSLSPSLSASLSPSSSSSSSVSPSSSPSASEAPVISGSTVWGHSTGATENNKRTFATNWTGTGAIENTGDNERLALESGEYMVSEIVETGAVSVTLTQNQYRSGDTVTLKYRHGNSQAACTVASWLTYTVPFMSDGYVQIRLESTL